jgi:hypothetical protein
VPGVQDQGQAISGITFSVNGTTDTSLSLSSVAGNEVMLSNGSFGSPQYKTFTAGLGGGCCENNSNVFHGVTYSLNAFNPNHPVHMIVGPNASFSGSGGGNSEKPRKNAFFCLTTPDPVVLISIDS